MTRRNSKKKDRPAFDTLRKPIAPGSKKFGDRRLEEKVHPAGRNVKHKKPKGSEDQNGDVQ